MSYRIGCFHLSRPVRRMALTHFGRGFESLGTLKGFAEHNLDRLPELVAESSLPSV